MTKSFLSNRRNFLKCAGIAGLGAVVGVGISQRDRFESIPIGAAQTKTSHTRLALGTRVSMTAIHSSQTLAEDAIGAAFQDLQMMEQQFSRFNHSSPLCELNETQCLEHISDEMLEVLAKCQYFYQDTQGAFDITVQPLLDMFAKSFAADKEPTSADIEALLPLIGAEKLSLKGRSLRLPKAGMALSLDGVVPGFIADRAAAILQRHQIEHYLIDAGGEIRVQGDSLGGSGWRIAIQDPHKGNNFPGILQLHNGGVSTSGNYEAVYSANGEFHHIIDAKTGRSPQQNTSVTVLAPTAIEADILSTAVFVMSPSEGIGYINARSQYACLIIDKNGEQYASRNFVMQKA